MGKDFKAEYTNVKTDLSYREVLTSPWLGAIDFDDDKDTVVVLEYAFSATAKFEKGREDTCVFGRFKGYDKDIVINSGNCKQIHKFTGTSIPGEWKNVPLQIFIDQNVKRGSDIVSGWRIRPKQPKLQKPSLTPANADKWNGAATALGKSETTIDAIRKHYELSDDNASKLMELAMQQAPVTEEI